MFYYFKTEYDVKLIITNANTKENIDGIIFIDSPANKQEGIKIYVEKEQPVFRLRRGKHRVQAASHGYQTAAFVVRHSPQVRYLPLKKMPNIPELIPLSLAGWGSWNEAGISPGERDNECIVNGVVRGAGGFNSEGLSASLRGKTLVLFVSNTQESIFVESRLIKITYNRNDLTLLPIAQRVVFEEYIPVEDTPLDRGIEYQIPENFDGKLGFVFYNAGLRNLKITAFYY